MNSKQYILQALLCTLLFLVSGGSQAVAQTTPDPGIAGPYTVLKAEYNFGNRVILVPDFPDSLEVIGSVHYPSDLSAGPFPVLLFLHGRHSTCYETDTITNTSIDWPCPTGWQPITSYEGYDYLANNMASHGYIVISISCNAINSTDNSVADYGMMGRGELVQYHLDLWNTWNTVGGAPFDTLFKGKLDMQNIGTMGHSRGGEGVIFNALYNQSLGSPYGIHAVLTLAPVDFERHILHSIPLLDVSPYCDGDVNDIEGVHFYDDSRYSDTGDYAPKHTVLFMGANHNYFNTVWTPGSYIAGGADDWLYGFSPTDPQCGPSAVGNKRFDTTVQKAALTAYMAAFYRVYIGHETQFAPILDVDDIVPPASSTLDSSQVFVSYQPSPLNRLDVNRTTTLANDSSNTLVDTVTEHTLVSSEICGGMLGGIPDCGVTTHSAQKPHNDADGSVGGLVQMGMRWSDSLQWYQNELPAADENLSEYKDMQFRASVNFAQTVTDSNLNFSVQLIDSEGHTSNEVVSHYSHALFYQPGTQPSDLPKILFNTIKLPLSGFSGVTMTKIRKIKFLFDKSTAGSIFISDLAFSNPACSILNANFSDSVGKLYKIYFTNRSQTGNGDSVLWNWNFGDPTSGIHDTSTLQTPPAHTYPSPGFHTVCLKVTDFQKNGYICTDSFCLTMDDHPDETQEVNANKIAIIPNPAKDYIQITGAEKTDVLTLMNLYGQVVLTTTIANPVIYLPRNLATGIYYAVITTENGRVYQKLLIER